MAAQFDEHGVAFQYPENWQVDRQDSEEGWTVSIQSPGTAFVLISCYTERPDSSEVLQASLQARDSAVVRITLARVYLEQKKPDLARAEVQRALKLAPNYPEAKELLEHLQNGKSSGGAQ